MMINPMLIAQNSTVTCELLPNLANRHGLITGATGTGKTVTLQTLAEQFSAIGVPVFMADIKGDLTGISQSGSFSEKIRTILQERGIAIPQLQACPVTLWDIFGEQGHPVRATISDMGPLLLARMLSLNDTQTGVLNLVFKIADDNGLLLLDMKDLRAMLQYIGDNAKQFTTEYGNISTASIGAIQRGLMQIEQQGGDHFFGEPMLNISDLMQTVDGKGVVNILAADKLMHSPQLYAAFLLWMLSELFEQLPEIGDPEKPRLVFFFDEAHLLFNDAPKVLVERIELVVRLIRSPRKKCIHTSFESTKSRHLHLNIAHSGRSIDLHFQRLHGQLNQLVNIGRLHLCKAALYPAEHCLQRKPLCLAHLQELPVALEPLER